MSRLSSVGRLAGVCTVAAVLATAGSSAALRQLPVPRIELTTDSEAASARIGPVTRLVAANALTCPGPQTSGAGASPQPPAPSRLTVAAAPAGLVAGPGGTGPGGTGSRVSTGGRLVASLLPAPAAPAPGPLLTAGSDPRHRAATVRTPGAVAVLGSGDLAPGLTGEQTTLVTGGDQRGLSSITCTAPAADAWLVGGGGDEGRRGRLVLANPAGTPVDVGVDVLSADGPVPPTSGSSVAVAARSRVVLLLDALAPGVRAPVLHVRATGGAVSAALHDSLLSGITPGGSDDVAPAAPPARRVLVPGLTINGRAVLRLAAPGSAEAVGQVRLLGPHGPVDPPGGPVVRVPAGGTLDVDLTGLPAGTYGAEVVTDVPVVAGGMVARGGDGGPADLAWLASTAPLTTLTGLPAVRSGGGWSTTVELTAPRAAAAVDVTTVGSDGSTRVRTLRVAGGTSTLTVLSGADSAWLTPARGSGEVVAARTTTYADRAGRLITAASLADLVTTRVEPVVRPAG